MSVTRRATIAIVVVCSLTIGCESSRKSPRPSKNDTDRHESAPQVADRDSSNSPDAPTRKRQNAAPAAARNSDDDAAGAQSAIIEELRPVIASKPLADQHRTSPVGLVSGPVAAVRPIETGPSQAVSETTSVEATAPSSRAAPRDVKTPVQQHSRQAPDRWDSPRERTVESEATLERFHQLLRRKPLHRPAFEGLVKHYAGRNELPELVRHYEERVGALPDDHALRIVLARLYLRTSQPEKAVELIDKLSARNVTKRRDSAQLLSFQSRLYQRVGRGEEAIAMLKKAIAEAETIALRTRLTEGLSDLYLQAGERELAAQALVDLAAQFPDQFFHRKRLADALAKRNLHEEAIRQYGDILKLVEKETDKHCEVLRQLGRSQEKLGRRDAAIRTYTNAINLLAGGHWMQRELHQRIVALYRGAGRIDELVRYCEAQIKNAPEQTVIRERLADVLAAAGRTDEAKERLAEAVRLFPKNRSLSSKRVELLERVKDFPGAAEEYERIIARFPDEVESYISYGRFLARNQKLDQARSQWKHVLDREVADATLAHRLGGLFEQFELLNDAAECYRRAIQLAPKRPEGYTALSRLWTAQGERDSALDVLRQMSTANPDNAPMHARLSSALLGLSLPEEALSAIAKACRLDPDQYRYQMARADLLQRTGEIEQSLSVRRRVIDLIQNGPQQMKAIGVLVSMHNSSARLEQLKQAERARLESEGHNAVSLLLLALAADAERDSVASRKYLDTLLHADPRHEEARRQLALLHAASGNVEAAVREYRAMIDLGPARSRAYYQAIAELKLRYDDRAGAIETFEQLIRHTPQNAAVLRLVAEQMLRLEQMDKALLYFRQSVNLQPENHQGRLQYARALKQTGQFEEALREFKQTALQTTDRNSAADAISLLYEAASQLGDVDNLLDELRSRIDENPDDTVAARVLAVLYIREYEYSRATQLLELLLRHHPGDVNLRLVRADLSRRLIRFDVAIEEYQHVLRIQNVNRDYVLGELGKTYFESGRLDEARRTWKRVTNKLYAGTLLSNNGMPEDAIEVLREGIRLKPDAFNLHRNLVQTYEAAGQADAALKAAGRLADLEPDNALNIKRLAEAHLKRGDRAVAAQVAGRLLNVTVLARQPAGSASGGGYGLNYSQMSLSMMQMMSAYGYGAPQQNPLTDAVEFFTENGLVDELEAVLTRQLETQPQNGLLKLVAIELFTTQFGKPEMALQILKHLETAEIPREYQSWLGSCTQREYFRLRGLGLLVAKPALRDERLTRLLKKDSATLNAEDRVALAMIRLSLGARVEAVHLLEQAVKNDGGNRIALSLLVNTFVDEEKFKEAEAYAHKLIALLSAQRERLQPDVRERVKREFVRRLPHEMQLRVTDQTLDEIAEKWSQVAMVADDAENDEAAPLSIPGEFRARMTLATILAKTGRTEQAREIWRALEPANHADVESWIGLSGAAQEHGLEELAFDYYQRAMQASKQLASDSLLDRIYGGSGRSIYAWYLEDTFDSSFNQTLATFARHDKLIELYDFLRETEGPHKVRRVAKRYELHDRLQQIYTKRLDQARDAFRSSPDDALEKSVPYFMHVCKLAEIHDWRGNWDLASKVYEEYLEDFPDELGLLEMLGEIAEAGGDYARAIEWERRIVAAKKRLARRGPAWSKRSIHMVPSIPRLLKGEDAYSWAERWGKSYWGGYGGASRLDVSNSLMRMAQLHLALDNRIAAIDSMQQAIRLTGTRQNQLTKEILETADARQLTKAMLPVFRSLIVRMPNNREVQLALADSLEKNGKTDAAAELYRRMLRRGVTDLDVLNQIRRRLKSLNPESAPVPVQGLADLETSAKANPDDVRSQFRLAKAYFYSLQIEKALLAFQKVQAMAPHLQGLERFLVEIHALKGNTEQHTDMLRSQLKRAKSSDGRWSIGQELADVFFNAGNDEAALETLRQAADPRVPETYGQVGLILQYFGRHDEALEQFRLMQNSQGGGSGTELQSAPLVAQALAYAGKTDEASQHVFDAVRNLMKQTSSSQSPFANLYYGSDLSEENSFQPFVHVFVAYPPLLETVKARVSAEAERDPDSLIGRRMLVQLHRMLGRDDLADALLNQPEARSLNDQSSLRQQIDRAVERMEHEKVIELAEQLIAQQKKTELPTGIPAQYAAQMMLGSDRMQMICLVGDLHWKLGRKERAFESYRRIFDEKIDATQVAYATICAYRGRVTEAREIVEKALRRQELPSRSLLQFQAFLAAIDGDANTAFDVLLKAAGTDPETPQSPFGDSDGRPDRLLATLAQETGRNGAYRDLLESRIRQNPNDWTHYRQLSKFLAEIGNPGKAREVIEQAASVTAVRKQAIKHRVWELEKLLETDSLIPLYQELIGLTLKQVKSKGSRSPYFGMGLGHYHGEDGTSVDKLRARLSELLWQRGKHEEAQQLWQTGLDDKDPDTHTALARKLAEREDFARAEERYEEALRLEPTNLAAHAGLLEQTFHRGDFPSAAIHFHEVLRGKYRRASRMSEDADSYQQYDAVERGDESQTTQQMAVRLRNGGHAAEAPHGQSQLNDDPQAALMLAAMTGDWDRIDSTLTPLMETSPYDAALWKLWTESRRRKADWVGTLRGLQQLERIASTHLPSRHTQLKLVLAGKQVKGAAAGVTGSSSTSATGASSGIVGSSYRSYGNRGSSYSRWRYDTPNDDQPQMTDLCIQAGRFDKAERLYLMQRDDFAADSLVSLINLAQLRGRPERVAELARLWIGHPSQERHVDPVVDDLAKSGQVELAIDLLIRMHHLWDPNSASANYPYGQMHVYSSIAFEDDDEQQPYLAQLYRLLENYGQFDAAIEKLSQMSRTDPGDIRTAGTIVDLLVLHGDWRAARDRLRGLLKAHPKTAGLNMKLLRLNVQLRDWPSALALAETMQKENPDASAKWRTLRAVLHVMADESDLAVKLCESGMPEATNHDPAFAALLLATDQHERLIQLLQERYNAGRDDESPQDELFELYGYFKQWDKAAALALAEVWKSEGRIEQDEWFGRLDRLVRSAGAQVAQVTAAAERDEDKALIQLIQNGPAAGVQAFGDSLRRRPDSVDSHRGLIVAAMFEGDDTLAEETNERLLAWLKPRRRDIWKTNKRSTFEQQATLLRTTWSENVSSTRELLSESSLTTELLQGLLQSGDFSGGGESRYSSLWEVHRALRKELLIKTGKLDEFVANAQAESTSLLVFDSYGFYGASYYGEFGGLENLLQNRQRSPTSWRETVEEAYARHGNLAQLVAVYDQLGSRLPEDSWLTMSELCAALGRVDDSRKWKHLWIERQLTSLKTDDRPEMDDIDDEDQSYNDWRYHRYGNDDRWSVYRRTLATSHPDGSNSNDRNVAVHNRIRQYRGYDGYRSIDDGRPGLVEFATEDPKLADELLKLAERVGPGWQETKTAKTAISYFFATEQPQRVIDLLERMGPVDRLAKRNETLTTYLKAAYQVRDYARIEKALAVVETIDPRLGEFVALERLMLFRHQGQTDEADRLETRLLGACAAPPIRKRRGNEPLAVQINEIWSGEGYRYRGGYFDDDESLDDFDPDSDPYVQLAEMAGLHLAPHRRPEDLTLAAIRREYVSHGFFDPSIRLVDREIQWATRNSTEGHRMRLISTKANLLSRANRDQESRELFDQVRQYRAKLLQGFSGDNQPDDTRLAIAPPSERKNVNPDYQVLLDEHLASCKKNWRRDPHRLREAYYLYHLERYNQAWSIFEKAIPRGNFYKFAGTDEFFQAGIAAFEAGKIEPALELLRRAVWRNPSHELAESAKEMIRDASHTNQ